MACELAIRVIPRASRAGVAGMREDVVLVRLEGITREAALRHLGLAP